jgi:hypothetical protein
MAIHHDQRKSIVVSAAIRMGQCLANHRPVHFEINRVHSSAAAASPLFLVVGFYVSG